MAWEISGYLASAAAWCQHRSCVLKIQTRARQYAIEMSLPSVIVLQLSRSTPFHHLKVKRFIWVMSWWIKVLWTRANSWFSFFGVWLCGNICYSPSHMNVRATSWVVHGQQRLRPQVQQTLLILVRGENKTILKVNIIWTIKISFYRIWQTAPRKLDYTRVWLKC